MWVFALLSVIPSSATTRDVIRMGPMPEWKLVRRVEPLYPSKAREHRIQGVVKFNALLRKDGSIQSVRLVSGHPLSIDAAESAVRQWVYRPTLINGKAVRVVTVIVLEFRLTPRGEPVVQNVTR